MKRRNRAKAKLEPPAPKKSQVVPSPASLRRLGSSRADLAPPVLPIAAGEVEVLVCESCGQSFERMKVRGRNRRCAPSAARRRSPHDCAHTT